MIDQIQIILHELRKTKPLVLNLTNFVTMDFMANALLAIGAAPIMSVCDEELEELVKISHAININLGTLDEAFIKRCRKVIELAKQYEKPLILDPVGAGASLIRTKTACEFLEHMKIIRGNASEIISLYDANAKSLGVESIHSTAEAKDKARQLAKKYNTTVVVSGAIDFITDGSGETEVHYGSSLMPLITGMGCTLTAVIAAFCAVVSDTFVSAQLATNYFGLCGNIAEREAKTPGAFRTAFIDSLFQMTSIKINDGETHEI